jgi:RNA polymerase sigma factor (sigma-70 family)
LNALSLTERYEGRDSDRCLPGQNHRLLQPVTFFRQKAASPRAFAASMKGELAMRGQALEAGSSRGPAAQAAPPVSADGTARANSTDMAEVIDGGLVQAIAALPACFRSTIYLADIEGYQYQEVANILGIPVGTVISRLRRGRLKLRRQFAA